jgi:Ca2+-transporting ATPase
MDTLGALALATEPPTDDLMLKKPVGRVEPLITNVMWRNIFIQAIYQVIILLVLNYSGTKILKLSGTSDQQMLVKNTIIFNAFVFCQVSIFIYFLQLKTFPGDIPFVPAFSELFPT